MSPTATVGYTERMQAQSPASFVNRQRELDALASWWERPGGQLALVWGRRRVGKTALLRRFADGRRSLFHVSATRAPAAELELLSRRAAALGSLPRRDLDTRPFSSWDDAFDVLAALAAQEPLLVVLDEFPELVQAVPELPSILRAFWEEARGATQLRMVLCGSAVRVMQAMIEVRAPLYGRFDLVLPVHPFQPHEAALLLADLSPPQRAAVWGIVGGIPLYLSWWDQNGTMTENLTELFGSPGARLLTEGQLVLDTEGDTGELGRRILYAVATGRTKHNEVADAVGADPTRTLDRLIDLRLIERLVPVTEDPRRTRRRVYRIGDNFLAFWLGIIDRYRTDIELGLGRSIIPALLPRLEDHMGPRWEEAFRAHLRRIAQDGALGPDVVAVGSYWQDNRGELDAVVLSGSGRVATTVGEAKWARRVDGRRLRFELESKLPLLPRISETVGLAVCARERIDGPQHPLNFTAADLFG